MRLINANTLNLEDFTLRERPPYAILSHTWGKDEVSFQDMASPERSSKKGWDKIVQTCRLALAEGLSFAWVDTCCIDKSSSAELSEAINSMFAWYRHAIICYAFLSDLDAPDSDALLDCRWWARGWTLQELLAPRRLMFYDKLWRQTGSKELMCAQIAQRTGIPRHLLIDNDEDEDFLNLHRETTATKMSWAAHRTTTRIEDEAYCLLGIFDVNMPLIYGEGHKAFYRLQEEIMKRSNDSSIFAHSSANLIAESTSQFTLCKRSEREEESIHYEFAITNKGLKLTDTVRLYLWAGEEASDFYLSLLLGYSVLEGLRVAPLRLFLQQIGSRLYRKHPTLKVQTWNGLLKKVQLIRTIQFTGIYIIPQLPDMLIGPYLRTNRLELQVSLHKSILYSDAVPRDQFYFDRSCFMVARSERASSSDAQIRVIEVRHRQSAFKFFVLVNIGTSLEVYLTSLNDYRVLFDEKNAERSLSWSELVVLVGGHATHTDTIQFQTSDSNSVKVQARLHGCYTDDLTPYWNLTFDVHQKHETD